MTKTPSDISEQRYSNALRFLANRTNYERSQSMPHSEEALNLDRMRELLRRLGNPQQKIPTIHIAGTKGKGSTAAMTASILLAAGYRVGLFTSPHIHRVEERIVLDGRPCTSDELATLVEQVRPAVEQLDRDASPKGLGPTYFEILTAMAWLHFLNNKADFAVLEVGLGGRLDSTNVCEPAVSVITSISLDHVKQLGETLAAIAGEKAGIIKQGVPVISGVTVDEPREVIRSAAQRHGCRLIECNTDFDFAYRPPQHLETAPSLGHFDFLLAGRVHHRDISLALPGRHQAANAAVALAAIEELRRAGWTIPDAAIQRGLADVTWPARVEVVSRHPAVILDAAHNAASIAALVEALNESFSVRRRVLIFATTQEKDIPGMLSQLQGQFDAMIFTRYLNNPRNVPPEQLVSGEGRVERGELVASGQWLVASEDRRVASGQWPVVSESQLPSTADQLEPRHSPLATHHSPLASHSPNPQSPIPNPSAIHIAQTPAEAWRLACRLATPDDLICITGSFFFAAEMREQIAAQPQG